MVFPIMADKKILDPERASQENKSLESYLEHSQQHIISSKEEGSQSAAAYQDSSVLKPNPSLIVVHKMLYEHIKAMPADSSNFFMQQERTYKRELVTLMRRIDKQEITTPASLCELMEQMAQFHHSDNFNMLLARIKETLNIQPEEDNSLSSPRFPA